MGSTLASWHYDNLYQTCEECHLRSVSVSTRHCPFCGSLNEKKKETAKISEKKRKIGY